MKLRQICLALALVFAGTSLPGPRAEDIDLYTGGEQVTGAETNVLIFLDNSANWSNASGWPTTQGEAELAALKTVIDSLSDNVNVGVMMHAESGSASGAYVRFAMRPMNAENRARLKEVFDDIASTAPNAPQDKVSQSQVGDAGGEEVARYFNSLGLGFTGVRDTKEDYTNNTNYYQVGGGVSSALADKSHPTSIAPLPSPTGYAYLNSSSTTYQGPASAASGCAKNFLIWIGNTNLAGTTDGTRLGAVATALATTANTAQIPALNATAEAQQPRGVMLDEWARFMYQKGVKTAIDDPQSDDVTQKLWNPITTYTVDVFPRAGAAAPQTCTQETAGGAQQVGQHYQMQSMANAGNGECYPATDTAQLEQALKTIFAKIQAVNSVFTSAALPASVNVQGTFENQVYFGIFRPDVSARQRWFGNLKAYKFGRYCDANNNNKVDGVPADGVISTCPHPADADGDGVPAHTYPITTDERIPECEINPVCSSGEVKLYLSDARDRVATDETTGSGFFDLTAISHWTSGSTFWNFAPTASAGGSDSPDGPLVERGGAAQKLRDSFASRTVYTCIEPGCIGGTFDPASPRALNAFADTGEVHNRLTVSGLEAVTLTRSGNTVTATASDGAHTYADGALVSIDSFTCSSDPTGSCAQYSGLKTISTGGSTSTFTYTISEQPANDTSGGAYYEIDPPTYTISNIALSSVGGIVTATVTTSTPHGLSTTAPDNLVSIAGVKQSFLAGNRTVSAVPNTTTFEFVVGAMPDPANAGTSDGTGSSPLSNVIVAPGTGTSAQRITLITTSNLGADYSAGSNVTVAGVDTAALTGINGTWESIGTGPTCGVTVAPERNRSWCFNLKGTPLVVGQPMTATKVTGPANIDITRTPGSTVFTATLRSGTHTLSGGETIAINGSTQPDYNNRWLVLAATSGTNSFTVERTTASQTLTLKPPAPPAAAVNTIAGVSSGVPPTADQLVRFMKGAEVPEDENRDLLISGVRASIHGDALHSRPLVLNYGGIYGARVFYGANDGFLHAIQGGLDAANGTERWAFIPEEFVELNRLNRTYANSPLVRFPNLTCGILPEPTGRNYFWDGQISALRSAETVAYNAFGAIRPDGTATTADYPYSRPAKTYIYATMRRGGRSIYAMDVSNPDDPKVLWRIKGGSTTGFDQLAQTWSQPKLARIKGTFAGTTVERVVLIFGAGYDPADEDVPPGAARGDRAGFTGIGRGVYVVDAFTGAKIAFLAAPTATSKHSFAADVSLMDMNGDGYADRIYAADTGANLYRFDLTETLASATEVPGTNWTAHHLAHLGVNAGQTGTSNRKFMFGPTLVPFVKDGQNYVAVMVGSGDREKPLPNRIRNAAGTVVDATLSCSASADRYYDDAYFGAEIDDRFYTIFDQATAPASPYTESNLQNVNADPTALDPYVFGGSDKGWYIELANDPDADSVSEEKTVNAVLALGSSAFFATNTPIRPDVSRGLCAALGQARGYAVNILTGLPAFNRDASVDPSDGTTPTLTQRDYAATFVNGGLPPTAVYAPTVIGGRVYDVLVGTGGETLGNSTDALCQSNPELCTNTTVLTPLNPDILIQGQRSKVYWFYGKE